MHTNDFNLGPAIALGGEGGLREGAAPANAEADADADVGDVRVLHIAESALGGVGTYLNQIVPRLAQFGGTAGLRLNSRVLLPEQHARMVGDVAADGVFHYRRDGRSPADLIRLARAALRHVREFRPEIVHLHSTFAGAVLRPLLLLSRLAWNVPRRTVYSPHGWAFQISGSRLKQRLVVLVERVLSLWSDRIIVLSDAELEECIALGFRRDKLVRIYNGLSAVAKPAAPARWDDPRLKVFFTGRLDRQKGLDVLLRAAELGKELVAVRCAGASVVDGEAPPSVPANVELLGWLSEPEIEGQLACADIVAVPSRWEGFGLVAVEAMRASLPVVASRIGGLPEVVEDGATGTLIPPDDPAALLAALLADDGSRRKQMGAAGRRRFLALFTSDRSADSLGQVYAGLLDR